MKYNNLLIAQSEFDLIQDLMQKVDSDNEVLLNCYNKLRKELESAEVVVDEEMPKDVVRLNSFIDIHTPVGPVEGYQLVMPALGNASAKKLSLITPMGSALIGYAMGDELLWNFPSGEKAIQIKRVY